MVENSYKQIEKKYLLPFKISFAGMALGLAIIFSASIYKYGVGFNEATRKYYQATEKLGILEQKLPPALPYQAPELNSLYAKMTENKDLEKSIAFVENERRNIEATPEYIEMMRKQDKADKVGRYGTLLLLLGGLGVVGTSAKENLKKQRLKKQHLNHSKA